MHPPNSKHIDANIVADRWEGDTDRAAQVREQLGPAVTAVEDHTYASSPADEAAPEQAHNKGKKKIKINERIPFTDFSEVFTPGDAAQEQQPTASAVEHPSTSFVHESFEQEEPFDKMNWPSLEQFDHRQPSEWFMHFEEEMSKHNITNGGFKFNLLVDNLTAEVRSKVQSIINWPPWQLSHGDLFEKLKTRLLQVYGDQQHSYTAANLKDLIFTLRGHGDITGAYFFFMFFTLFSL